MDVGAPPLEPERSRKPELPVVAALILRDSRILVCQRRRDDSHALQWEFPGGKVEPGEIPQEALARELREELGIEAKIGKELFRTRHRYRESGQSLELIFFRASVDRSASLQNLVFEGFEWADPSALLQYDFLQADEEFVALLASRAIPLDWSA
ncbi:MAG TPA: (deoxy)nucleoside triphosphate pyrophosphohydrolase [Candidatus Acidoferrales bacterium]|jgi:8-oxo-dGTP diphosphatase|nr:(deoxy)nucleoside triphosphate pyrophosphohydrolase [Candidatus Acidoferrales bacterium]